MSEQAGCPCDERPVAATPAIAPGLETIPRRIGEFADFRRALLAGVPTKPALAGWRARSDDDLGMMLIDLWAYACDALAFADETIAHEAYLRTARLRPSLRRLVELLGYVPRPAVGASSVIGALASGRQPVELPAATAFRAAAFGGEPPQVFELDEPAVVHPLTNRWRVERTRAATIADPPAAAAVTVTELLMEPRGPRPVPTGPILIQAPAAAHARLVATLADVAGADGEPYARVTLDAPVSLPGTTTLAALRLSRPTQTAGLWTLAVGSIKQPGIEDVATTPRLTLDALYRQIKPAATVLLAQGSDLRWFRVVSVVELQRAVSEPVKVGSPPTELPAVKVPVTQLTLDAPLNDPSRRRPGTTVWRVEDAATVVVHHALTPAGSVTAQLRTRLASGEKVHLVGVERPESGHAPTSFLLEDRNGRGVAIGGRVNFATGELTPDADAEWDPDLVLPVDAYGNAVRVTRGETIARETLGSGDASIASQSFTLKRKPLTYLAAPEAASGVSSTLRIWVDGIRWHEVPSFFATNAQDRIYVVRTNDAGDSTVTFGDGIHGARLPTGRGNVVGSYRAGAGAATPPPGAIAQLLRPVPGLTGVRDPVGAAGGADAEAPDAVRRNAPRSALLLGRAVSIRDLEATAARVPGVRAARAQWRWSAERQRPLVQVWYVGPPQLEPLVSRSLRSLSDPSLPIDVDPAEPVPATLALELRVDPLRVAVDVTRTVRQRLLDPDAGLLAPERVGIGVPLIRSRAFEAAMAVAGVEAVRSLVMNGAPFPAPAANPGAGRFFDFEAGLDVTSGGGAGG